MTTIVKAERFKGRTAAFYEAITSSIAYSRFDGQTMHYCNGRENFIGLKLTESSFNNLFDRFYENRKAKSEDRRRPINEPPLITCTRRSASSEYMYDVYEVVWQGFTFLLCDLAEKLSEEGEFYAWIPDQEEYRKMLLLFKLTWITG